MRLRRRVTLAAAVALALHALTVVVVSHADVRAVSGRPSTRVEIALVAPRAAPAPGPPPTLPAAPIRTTPTPTPAPTPTPTPTPTPQPTPTTQPTPTPKPTPTPTPQPTGAPASPRAAPTTPAPPTTSPRTPAAPPVVAQPAAPRSLLERVLAGSSLGPRPSVDTLDPSLRTPERDGARAKRFIDGVARVDRPSVDAGPTSILGELVAVDGGGYQYTTGGFVAFINVDGSVVFADKDGSAGPSGGERGPHNEIVTERDPNVDGVPLPHPGGVHGSQLNASFDPTAALLRAQGQDPYFSEKSCFLDDTADLRADLREKHEAMQLAVLRRDLERAWFDGTHTAGERRARLFAIWDECREDGIGAKARVLVESFVRQHLPENSNDAYSDEELVALNARRTSKEEFQPYG